MSALLSLLINKYGQKKGDSPTTSVSLSKWFWKTSKAERSI